MLTIKELNEKKIEEKINDLIKSGKYSSISDLKRKNPTLKVFCMKNGFQCVYRSFSSQFTELDYNKLLERMDEKKHSIENNESEIKKTNIGNQTFINIDNNNKEANSNNETLVSLESTSTDINTINDFHKAQKYDKPVANFIKKDDVRISSLSQEELNTFQKIQNATGDNNVSIFYDETGTMTKTVRDDFNNYSKVDDIDGEDHLVSQESSKSQGIAKQKVLTTSSRKPTNISAAFTNTLILSFIIGSFFGVVFLAIYLKVMH